MKRNEKKVPGFDEIIFENRNKEYGAYDLRKRYKSTASLSLLGVLTICAVIFILASAFAPKDVTGPREVPKDVIWKIDNTIDPNKLVKPEVPKPIAIKEQNKYVPPIVIEDTLVTEEGLMTNDMAASTIKDGNVADTLPEVINVVAQPGTGEPEEPYIKVEEDPMFPGGNPALQKYIAENTKYPVEASENNIQGKVIVKFAVWSDGSVKKIEVMRSIHPSLDEEAMRVVSTLPTWKPGKQNGRPVPVWFYVPVNFQMINR